MKIIPTCIKQNYPCSFYNKFASLVLLLVLLLTMQSCKKEEEKCATINCNSGIQNSESCLCDCPEGYLGVYCQIFDPNKIQILLNNGESPSSLYAGGISLDSLYGKQYSEGLIFYLDTVSGNGMVAALSSYIPYNPTLWGCPETNISGINNIDDCQGEVTCFQPIPLETAIGARIGDGFSNTNAILVQCSDTTNAASLCRSLGDEWFLPSRGELNQLYINLHSNGLGDFEDHSFLSSTEGTFAYSIWTQSFENGQILGSDKFVATDFRAVKEF